MGEASPTSNVPVSGDSTHPAARSSALPLVCGVLAIMCLATSPVMNRSITAPAPAIALGRLWTIVPVWIVILAIKRDLPNRRTLAACLPSGLMFGVSNALAVESFTKTSIANATLIGAMQPIATLAISVVVLKQRRPRHDFPLALIGVVGIAIVVFGAGKTSGASRAGDLYSLLNVFVFIAYMYRLKAVRSSGIGTGQYLMSMLFWSAVTVTPWTLLTAGREVGQLGGKDWFYIAMMNVLSFIIGHGLLSWAQRSLDVVVTSLLMLPMPVVSMLAAWWIHGQTIRPVQAIGAAIVLSSLAASVVMSRPTEPVPIFEGEPVIADSLE